MSNNQFHTVRQGDNLSKIAKQHGTTVQELSKINGISNANRISVGSKIALKREAVCNVGFQFLDRDRNPLRNTKVRIEYCGKVTKTSTGENGRVPDILTDSPIDVAAIWIQRAEGGWKKITEVTSDWGNKLVTLTSPKVRVEASTHPHPQDKDGLPIQDKREVKAKAANSVNQKTSTPTSTQAKGKPQSMFGEEKGTKVEEHNNAHGLPIAAVTNDQEELDFLKKYEGGQLTDDDYVQAAKEIGCESEIVRAVAQVESGGVNGFDKKNRPVILFEKHVFSRCSKGKYDETYPFISSKKGYRLKKKGEKVSSENLAKDFYSASSEGNYARLAKAYVLDQEAALMGCSWGKFQVLGENYKLCGYASVRDFVLDHVKNESGQLRGFVGYVKGKKLQPALKAKDWEKIARGYNGKHYKKFRYDERIRKAYESIKNK